MMENTVEKTMNAWQADAEKFTGDKAMFWAGKMSTMIGVIARSGVSVLSVNVAVAERCKEEYDHIIFGRT